MTKDHTGRAGWKSGRVGWRRLSGNMGCARKHSDPPLTTSHKHGSIRGLQTLALSQCPCCARRGSRSQCCANRTLQQRPSLHPWASQEPCVRRLVLVSSAGNGHDAPGSTQHCSSEPLCHRHARTALIQIQIQITPLPSLRTCAVHTHHCTVHSWG